MRSRLRKQLARWFAPKTLGQRGEAVAARYLHKLGYTIVARGDRSRLGEIDLIAVDDRTVVFVEVKTRRSHDAGHPAEAVGLDKQRRLTQAALTYLKAHGLLEHSARFDVVALTWPKSARQPKLEHFQDAFEAVGRGQLFN
jgi:putative endonuclease